MEKNTYLIIPSDALRRGDVVQKEDIQVFSLDADELYELMEKEHENSVIIPTETLTDLTHQRKGMPVQAGIRPYPE